MENGACSTKLFNAVPTAYEAAIYLNVRFLEHCAHIHQWGNRARNQQRRGSFSLDSLDCARGGETVSFALLA